MVSDRWLASPRQITPYTHKPSLVLPQHAAQQTVVRHHWTASRMLTDITALTTSPSAPSPFGRT